MTLNQLRYFQAVARLQNFRAAAEQLYISQPSLSRSIDSLEDELGVVLFERAGRGIALTGSGRLFLEYANRILEECDIAVYKMKEISTFATRAIPNCSRTNAWMEFSSEHSHRISGFMPRLR